MSKKEQETNKLANQRKKAKEAQALVVDKISGETNAYQLSNIQSDVKTLDLSITLPTKTKITLKKNDETINDTSKVYTGTFNQSLELSDDCTFEISIETYSDDSISIDGQEISFEKEGWKQGDPAIRTLQIGKGYQKPVEEEEETEYVDGDYDYDYGYTDEDLYAQGEDVTYGQDKYTEQTNNY